jgi:hypothetical protein
MGAAPRFPREIDVDLGEPERGRAPAPRPAWSVAVLGVPLPMVWLVLVQTVAVAFWVGQQSTKLDTVLEQQKESRAETYKQADATRDLALRDDWIAELGRRMELVEKRSR